MFTLIEKNNNKQISNNFTSDEYYNASFGNVGDSFEYSNAVINGAQIIREFFARALKPTSTYRTSEHDKSKGRSGTGAHTQRLAGDFSFNDEETLLLYHSQILNKGELYQQLRQAGINGFGLYDNFLHIDGRAGGNQPDEINGSFAFWDKRITTKKKKSQR